MQKTKWDFQAFHLTKYISLLKIKDNKDFSLLWGDLLKIPLILKFNWDFPISAQFSPGVCTTGNHLGCCQKQHWKFLFQAIAIWQNKHSPTLLQHDFSSLITDILWFPSSTTHRQQDNCNRQTGLSCCPQELTGFMIYLKSLQNLPKAKYTQHFPWQSPPTTKIADRNEVQRNFEFKIFTCKQRKLW